MIAARIEPAKAQAQLHELLHRLQRSPSDARTACQLAEMAVDHGLEEEASPAVARAAERVGDDPRLWQMLALLYRGIDLHDRAIEAFGRAAKLAPTDRRIAYGLALSSLEAGLPASVLFERLLRLDPQDEDSRLGYVASLKAEGRGGYASTMLQEMLRASPFWIEGHRTCAGLSATLRTGRELASIDAAIADHGGAVQLRALRLDLLARLASPEEYFAAAARARSELGNERLIIIHEAIAASEAGLLDHADAQFLTIGRHDNPRLALALLRHLVRAQRFAEADSLAARLTSSSEATSAWAYRHTAWRALGDPHLGWLEHSGDLIRSLDLTAVLPPLDQLADVLRGLHDDVGPPLDHRSAVDRKPTGRCSSVLIPRSARCAKRAPTPCAPMSKRCLRWTRYIPCCRLGAMDRCASPAPGRFG
jgi:cytochrome c-type biogenesis protein CcmH/NrfG